MAHNVSQLIPLRCKLCGGPMKLVRKLPAADAQPEMAVYQCEQCRHKVTQPVQDE